MPQPTIAMKDWGRHRQGEDQTSTLEHNWRRRWIRRSRRPLLYTPMQWCGLLPLLVVTWGFLKTGLAGGAGCRLMICRPFMRHDECNREGSFCNSDEGPFVQSNRASPPIVGRYFRWRKVSYLKGVRSSCLGQVNTFARVQMYSFATLVREEEEGPDPWKAL